MRSASVPCGAEFQFELARQILPLEFLVLADVRRDHLLNLPRLQQHAEPEAVDPGVVRHDGQILNARGADRLDQLFGDAAQAEAARDDGHAVGQHALKSGGGIGVYFAGHDTP